MNLLKLNLEKLYLENPEFEKFFPFNEYYEKIEVFMFAEIAAGHDFLNPYKFARVTNIDISKALVFFVYISSIPDNRTLKIKYRYTCSSGTDSFLYEDELENFVCDEDCNCEKDIDLKFAIEEGLVDVPIFFEIDFQLKSGLVAKDSSFNYKGEGGVSREIENDIAQKEDMVTALIEMKNRPSFFKPSYEKWKNDLLESRKN
ncbi:hypothetical protein [Exiguobacterium profundum]|uniref:hypothetical protein n=1 Tax=Exiguobacterium profundum TaxID=307643 RepID=UPI0028965797|nr:hypothetical protein [Exiguobacterium profundum]